MANALKTFRLDATRPVVEIEVIKCHNAEFLMDTHYHHFENDRFVRAAESERKSNPFHVCKFAIVFNEFVIILPREYDSAVCICYVIRWKRQGGTFMGRLGATVRKCC